MRFITLPYPPSANAYWRNVRGRVVVSAEARAYKRKVGLTVQSTPLDGPLAIEVHVYRPRKAGDLDNTLKVLCDALNGIAWRDDSQVVEIHAYRGDDKADPRVELRVWQLGIG